MRMGNLAHRAPHKGGYFPVNPIDTAQDIRGEMLSTMKRMGIKVDKHHHEVATCQHELGMIFGGLVEQADNIQKYKYVIHNVAAAYGKSVTFMPKPMKGDNGSGMHVNMSIWKDGKPLFAGDKYADLSQEALYFIGGILKHAKALNALTNPATNSYKRLIPGFEAPVLRAYSARNRSGCVRIPWTESPKAKRVEARFPDPAANPYLAFAALLMAGSTASRTRSTRARPRTRICTICRPKNWPRSRPSAVPCARRWKSWKRTWTSCWQGDVFTRDQLESYIKLKWEEVYAYEHTPHPVEYPGVCDSRFSTIFHNSSAAGRASSRMAWTVISRSRIRRSRSAICAAYASSTTSQLSSSSGMIPGRRAVRGSAQGAKGKVFCRIGSLIRPSDRGTAGTGSSFSTRSVANPQAHACLWPDVAEKGVLHAGSLFRHPPQDRPDPRRPAGRWHPQ
jgi:hypothetical protein